jgi:Mn-dependent DtxR family transcriptional regulator
MPDPSPVGAEMDRLFDNLREQRERTNISARRLEGLIRDEAVRRVDARYGYTCEFSSDPDGHRYEYDLEEETIREELGRD